MPTFRNDGAAAISVEDVSGNSVFISPGKSVETYKILPSPFVKTADAPYFPLVKIYEPTFASPGTKTGLLGCKIIRLTAGADGIMAKANHTSNPSVLSLIDSTPMDIENNGEIESLVFVGSGTVKIEGF